MGGEEINLTEWYTKGMNLEAVTRWGDDSRRLYEHHFFWKLGFCI